MLLLGVELPVEEPAGLAGRKGYPLGKPLRFIPFFINFKQGPRCLSPFHTQN